MTEQLPLIEDGKLEAFKMLLNYEKDEIAIAAFIEGKIAAGFYPAWIEYFAEEYLT